ncbi:Rha family transcriptional regulator [Oscillospiraceae bacterium 50-60]
MKRGLLKNEETSANYFVKSWYTEEQNGQTYPEYLGIRDGFSLLVMGFTGKEALELNCTGISGQSAD